MCVWPCIVTKAVFSLRFMVVLCCILLDMLVLFGLDCGSCQSLCGLQELRDTLRLP